MSEVSPCAEGLQWCNLSAETRELLAGKLVGIWGAPSDQAAFDSWPVDKQQALVILAHRLHEKGLWHVVKQVTNVYGEGGVGIQFLAWPLIESTLRRRSDFTRRFANHNRRAARRALRELRASEQSRRSAEPGRMTS